jgi:TolB-like protein/Tfp pilus assembly protein PilF
VKDSYRFGHCELNPIRRRLLVHGRTVDIGQRAFDVLLALVERAGDLATKDELLARAWPSLAVEENNLSQQVVALRKLIGASAIVSVPSLGYRLALSVEAGGLEEAAPSIAVLPFEDLSAEHDQEFFADGLAEDVLNALARIRSLRVVSRTSTFVFRHCRHDIPTIARQLGVEWILEGSVRKAGKRIRVAAQLIRAETDSHAWSQTYDRELQDVFAVQDEIARAVAKEIRPSLFGPQGGSTTQALPGSTRDTEAHRLFLLGRFFTEKSTAADLATGIAYLQQAVERAPDYAIAWAALARAHAFGDDYEAARVAVLSALKAEPDLAEGHSALAWVRFAKDWDWSGSQASNRRALELGPGNAEVLREAAYQSTNLDEGLDLARRATILDPLSLRALRTLGLRSAYTGDLDEAERSLRDALALYPGSARTSYHLGRVLLMQGRFDESLAAFEAEADEMGRMWGVPLALGGLGRGDESRKALEQLIARHSSSSAFQVAEGFAYLGETDQAFEWLHHAVEQRDEGISSLKLSPLLASLRSDARWQPLLAGVGLS